MNTSLDHVVFAWEDLDEITDVFSDHGLSPDYGGTHEDGRTEMATLGFEDGSYIELLSATTSETTPQMWPEEIIQSAGPCGWAVEVDDIRHELKRMIDRGVQVSGLTPNSRERPDETIVEWEVGLYGSEKIGQRVPFLISDRTPRDYRIQLSESVASTSLEGVSQVVIAVEELSDAIDQFQHLFDYPTPRQSESETFGAVLASFPGQPVILAEPLDETSWIANRLRQYQSAPCAYLIGTSDFDMARTDFSISGISEWFGTMVGWFNSDELNQRLGIIQD